MSTYTHTNLKGGARLTVIMRLKSLATKCGERARQLRSHVRLVRDEIKELSTRDSQLLSDDRPHWQGLWLKALSVGGHSRAKPNEHFRNNRGRELRRYGSTSQFPTTFPAWCSGMWHLRTKYRGYSGKRANLTGSPSRLFTSPRQSMWRIELTKLAFRQGNINPRKALSSPFTNVCCSVVKGAVDIRKRQTDRRPTRDSAAPADHGAWW
eukprot:6202540-Pleurochrysis_carterae.AAC.1